MKRVYVCNDGIIGIFSAIYDAWKTKLEQDDLGIVLKGYVNQEFFCEYIECVESEQKTIAVENLIKKHLGYEAYWDMYHAVLANDIEKGNAILGAMLEARKIPDRKKIMQHLSHPKVRKVFELSRKVANESHYFKDIVRFRELDNGILFAQIEPQNQILPCLGDHFSNRFPLENWMICDKTHSMFLVHRESQQWMLIVDKTAGIDKNMRTYDQERLYRNLWKEFFENRSIVERENSDRQRQHLPLCNRNHVTK